ncbi:anti-anti-sigma factor [Actinomadura craniellae]|uniref:Anti-anti-sigma factor n=1 Tax=Actinomadura craniellae TaxID=2231787 RepID=A0A365GXJ9_9ACTN|nr:STAS domain-containing protein [Actinomadura craniellae]RAY11567.1 anti-anti-sigma factor [Actinomadura craniellae]
MTLGAGRQQRIATLLRERREGVLDHWVAAVLNTVRGRTTQAELRGQLAELYELVVQAMGEEDGTAAGELSAALQELSRTRARQGFSPSETAVSVFGLKDAVLHEIEAGGGTGVVVYREFASFSKDIDDLGLLTFETYARTREQVIADQAEQLLELSTPVVKLWEGIVGVPLVGTLDSARTQVVMESLLQTLVDTGSEHAVIDITGVPAVDTEVAQHLLKTVVAARLMGAECVISGIRPQIAQTIVALGIEFGDIVTKATLADALAYALERSGVRVGAG